MRLKNAPMPRGQFAALMAIYHRPGSSGLETSMLADLDDRTGYMMISRLRRHGLIRTKYTQIGAARFAEHRTTAKGDRLAQAWLRFMHEIGSQLRRAFHFE